jgi:hypothetical protein
MSEIESHVLLRTNLSFSQRSAHPSGLSALLTPDQRQQSAPIFSRPKSTAIGSATQNPLVLLPTSRHGLNKD